MLLARWTVVLLFQFSLINSFAQSPYQLSNGLDIPILGAGTGLLGLNIHLNKRFPDLKVLDTVGLNMFDLPSIDRHVVYNWSTASQKSSDFLLRSSPIIPLVLPLLGGKTSRHKLSTTYAIALEGMLATYTLTEITKLLVKRKRPYTYGKSKASFAFDGNAQKSFFSGHSSYTAVNYFMGAKMFADFYPNSDLKMAIWSTAAIIPALTAWKRVKGGKHFVTDVLVGYVVGAAIGIIIPELHKN